MSLKRDGITGALKLITLNFSILSGKAFFKRKVRSLGGQDFTHWLPLYLGSHKKKAKFVEIMLRTLSILDSGSSHYSP